MWIYLIDDNLSSHNLNDYTTLPPQIQVILHVRLELAGFQFHSHVAYAIEQYACSANEQYACPPSEGQLHVRLKLWFSIS